MYIMLNMTDMSLKNGTQQEDTPKQRNEGKKWEQGATTCVSYTEHLLKNPG